MKISGSGTPCFCRSGEHLAHDDVEEAQPVAHLEQRLGAVHPHRRAEAAVELDDRGARERRPGGVVGDVDVGEGGMSSGSMVDSGTIPVSPLSTSR